MAGVSSAYSCHHVHCYNSSPLTVRLLNSILRTRQRQRFLPSHHPALASQSHQGTSFPDQHLNLDIGNQPKGSNFTLSQWSRMFQTQKPGTSHNPLSQVSRSEFLQGEPHPYALQPYHPPSTPPPSSGPRRNSH